MNESILPDQTCFPLNSPYSVHSLFKHFLSAYSVPGARERARAGLCQTSILNLTASWFSLRHKTTSTFPHSPLVESLVCSGFITYRICPLGPIPLRPPQSEPQLACCKPPPLGISSCSAYVQYTHHCYVYLLE